MEQLTLPQRAKVSCLSTGIQLTPSAKQHLLRAGRPISLFEYPTTGGVTFSLPGAGFVNAPFDGPFSCAPEAQLDHTGNGFVLSYVGVVFPVEVLPLPCYVGDGTKLPFPGVVMTHVDRVRLSPFSGCGFRCGFCDLPGADYRFHSNDTLSAALQMAVDDPLLPPRHGLISGGTPRPKDRPHLDRAIEHVLSTSPIPFDVMAAPRADDTSFIDRLVTWGVDGLSINIELFDPAALRRFAPQKGALGRNAFAKAISRALELTGGQGRVRSLLIVGLEPPESTLEGVEWLSSLGCDPVLSPFRPATGTALADHPIPDVEALTRVYLEAREIAERYGVQLGPRCIPCQHNALVLGEWGKA